MKIYSETSLRNFSFWSGACDRVKYLTTRDLDTIEYLFEELYPDGMEDVQVNDIFWFEEDWIAEMLGYNSFEDLINERGDDEDDL